MKTNKVLITLLTLCLWTICTKAQQLTPEQTGGIYYAYPVKSSISVQWPDGFSPFYISHYGRHGSRWLPDDARYEWVNAQFEDDSNLTPLGKKVKKRLQKIWNNARGNGGQLTALGARQHREIARRMADHYPEVFRGEDTRILAQSSTVNRCRTSMLAFCDELKHHYPQLDLQPETNPAHMAYINHVSAEQKALERRTYSQPIIATGRFVAALFQDPTKVREQRKLLGEMHTIASDMQDIPLKVSLWDIFTPEELQAVHDANNERMRLCHGTTPLNDGIPARSAISLWEDIRQKADEIIENKEHGAALRFGHDTALYRLLTLLQLSLPGTGMEDFLFMAANLQMVFARNAEGKVVVAFLLNEEVQHLPIASAYDNCYEWDSVKDYMTQRMHYLEHQRQLTALNTMVGTAPANTMSAGLFGKGSEEHGQTLPAVLVPNGQTFWTPQTRDTEQKCVAPYYYTDSLLQGFRASHWIVGGCTQDYGSFTVATLSGKLRLQPEERATRYEHRLEMSHPNYYGVVLPDERLYTEMTGLSHTAMMRVTPMIDGPLHIVINHNSDEQQGTVRADTVNKLIIMENPVHRIYQGWGEEAGFSGHLAVRYTDEIIGFCEFSRGVALTFNGRRGHPISITLATSFTSAEGAIANMEAEGDTFEQMMQQNTDTWVQRLHTIDVEDNDTTRINQFYGALYRTSFLPREMSDCDGKYPKFSLTPNPSPRGEGSIYSQGRNTAKELYTPLSNGRGTGSEAVATFYGDFSMWDTYRAVHPLLNIIAPKEAGDMMQSLVTMYEEGGWLPIFPCWNSYTAAMIGDHCSSVLADAYVKGITGFDAVKAYKGMRRNAMESPKTFEEYKDGMGRRALKSYIKYGYIPLEDSVKEAFHDNEQTSRTLEYAYDDFCVAQMAKALLDNAAHYTLSDSMKAMLRNDYEVLMKRSENWRNVINHATGYADGRHSDGRWEGNTDLVNRKSYITEGATCHYTWYVPQNIDGLIDYMGGKEAFSSKLDSMFIPMQNIPGSNRYSSRYWHGNEPCHQVAWLFAMAGQPEKTRHWVRHILDTEYNDTAGGLSGNDDAGQMSAWQLFASMGFYPVCPGTTRYVLAAPLFRSITINMPSGRTFTMKRGKNAQQRTWIDHSEIVNGGEIMFGE